MLGWSKSVLNYTFLDAVYVLLKVGYVYINCLWSVFIVMIMHNTANLGILMKLIIKSRRSGGEIQYINKFICEVGLHSVLHLSLLKVSCLILSVHCKFQSRLSSGLYWAAHDCKCRIRPFCRFLCRLATLGHFLCLWRKRCSPAHHGPSWLPNRGVM